MISPQDFQINLEKASGKKLKLRINNNRTTMLSVKWEPRCTKVSLHRMFLNAPPTIMDSLACYIRSHKKPMARELKAYIEDNVKKLDYSYLLDQNQLHVVGEVHHLKKLYDKVNKKYFNSEIDLLITWYGNRRSQSRSRIIFGQYMEQMRLIKIHRLLDDADVPEFMVRFVIYHEICHHVCPTYVDEEGITRIHNRAFKERERLFKEFPLVQQWIKENRSKFFNGHKRKYGRT